MTAEKSEENNGIMLTHRKDLGAEVLQSKGIQSEMGDSYEENGLTMGMVLSLIP